MNYKEPFKNNIDNYIISILNIFCVTFLNTNIISNNVNKNDNNNKNNNNNNKNNNNKNIFIDKKNNNWYTR